MRPRAEAVNPTVMMGSTPVQLESRTSSLQQFSRGGNKLTRKWPKKLGHLENHKVLMLEKGLQRRTQAQCLVAEARNKTESSGLNNRVGRDTGPKDTLDATLTRAWHEALLLSWPAVSTEPAQRLHTRRSDLPVQRG